MGDFLCPQSVIKRHNRHKNSLKLNCKIVFQVASSSTIPLLLEKVITAHNLKSRNSMQRPVRLTQWNIIAPSKPFPSNGTTESLEPEDGFSNIFYLFNEEKDDLKSLCTFLTESLH